MLNFLSGCSHIRVTGFNKKENTVTIQGGKFDSEADVQKAAEKYCGGAATLVSMDEKPVGSTTQLSPYGYSSTSTTVQNRSFYTYSCK